MEAYGVIRKDDDAAVEFSALQGSLSMMSKGHFHKVFHIYVLMLL